MTAAGPCEPRRFEIDSRSGFFVLGHMAQERTDIHGPYSAAPTVSGQVAVCRVCNTQWQVKGESDKVGCPFCGSDQRAISIHSEDNE